MKAIHVTASKSYDVLIGQDTLSKAGGLVKDLGKVTSAVIVSDDIVYPIYGETVRKSLEEQNIRVCEFVFPNGENSKCLAVYEELLEYLCSVHITRSDVLIALGGGVVGDLTGFAAATYQRGVRFVQIPTTLLAAVDSSVGGKTAVNLKGGKNQVGCFYQPSFVLCDTDTLKTLPEEEFKCGCAEVIKYGVLGNAEFFQSLRDVHASRQLQNVIETCVEMKRDIVSRDEFDRGERMLLNFGHTLGHSTEKCSGYKIRHGQAVAIGMALMAKCAAAMGKCDGSVADDIIGILEEYGLPTQAMYSLEDMAQAAMSDKKSTGTAVSLIVPEEIGRCTVVTVTPQELREWMRAGGIK